MHQPGNQWCVRQRRGCRCLNRVSLIPSVWSRSSPWALPSAPPLLRRSTPCTMAGTIPPGMVPSSAQIPPVGAQLPPMFAWGAPATYADLQLAATGFLQPQQGAAESRHRIWLRAFWNVLHWRFRLWLILIALPLAWVADWCFNKLRSLGVERSRAIVCAGIFAIIFPPCATLTMSSRLRRR